MEFSRPEYWSSLLQRIFPTQGLSPGLPLCRWILYQLSHKGNPKILEWVAYPFSKESLPDPGIMNRGLLHCRQILYQLSYKGNPKILEWVAYLFSIELLNPGFKPGSPALQGNSLPTELLGKPYGEPLTKEWYDFFCNFN